MENTAIEPVGTIRAGLGEGPLWDNERQLLYWIDIRLCRLYATDVQRGETMVRDLPDSPGCVALTDGDGLLLAMGQQLFLLPPGGAPKPIATLPDGAIGRFNDGKLDAAGRFWVGTATAEGHFDCALWRFDPATGFAILQPRVSMSNGIGWSPDFRRMYYVDSAARRLDAFDFDAEHNTIGNRRSLLTLPEGQLPDGLCVDADACIWLAVWGGACVLHLSPDGKELGRIALPTPLVTSCAFGGEDLETLFITTASEDDSDPNAGRLFAANVGVAGLPPGRATLP